MKVTKVAKIGGGQDGAIFGHELFRFNEKGDCTVYRLDGMKEGQVTELCAVGEFTLDKAEMIAPHSNAVCFGTEYYEEGDAYPLLYSNVYNNYAKCEDKLIGICCVYRLQKTDGVFSSKLVQLIKIGFCEDTEMWKASADGHGARPYGNFTVDRERGQYWAFVMRNTELGTRYFKFDLPKARDGENDEKYGVPAVTLAKEDIKEYFDTEYHRYVQGAILKDGVVYSTEGFTHSEINRPAMRLVEIETGKASYYDITKLGLMLEPEFIDFYGQRCLYSDSHGNLYEIEF